MATQDFMRFAQYQFAIESASFRYITQSWSGPGWDFNFSGRCTNDSPDEPVFPYGARLYTEASPLPIGRKDNYVGVHCELHLPYDDDSGEPYFGLKVMEEHDVSDLRLRFVSRDGDRYLIEISAMIAETVLGQPERLQLSAWATELPDHAYPT